MTCFFTPRFLGRLYKSVEHANRPALGKDIEGTSKFLWDIYGAIPVSLLIHWRLRRPGSEGLGCSRRPIRQQELNGFGRLTCISNSKSDERLLGLARY